MPKFETHPDGKTTLAYPLFHPRSRRPTPLTVSGEEFRREFPRESDHVEFKEGVSERAVQASAVAFSNSGGGVILIGVDDSGRVRGREARAGTADAIHTALSGAHDLGRYDLHALDIEGVAITLAAVARREQGFAQTSNGRVLVRRGTQDLPLFGSELQRLINERSTSRYETTLTDIPLDSVSPSLLRRVSEAHGWEARLPPREHLEHAGLVRDGRLTVAGALHLLDQPSVALGKAYVEVRRYPDDETADYDRREEIQGPLEEQLLSATRAVADHLGTELVVLGVRRYDLPRIPEVVIREAIANALAHRSYEAAGTPVLIELRPATVQVISPGALPEPVTVSNIRETSAARNLDVIKVLRRYGLAEDAGRGVDVMQDTMRSEMLEPPTFRDTGHSVVVVLPIRSAVAPIERAWIRELEGRGTLEGSDRLVLVHAARGEPLTNARVRSLVKTDSLGAREILRRLCDRGFLKQHGQRGGATYSLVGSLRPPAGMRLGPDELATLVESLAVDGPIQNADVRRVTGLDRAETLALLDRLVREGRLLRTGLRRGARYHRP
jgi:ATP-dependent DNA helicase RecG